MSRHPSRENRPVPSGAAGPTGSTKPGEKVLRIEVVQDEAVWLTMRDPWNELLDDSVYPNVFARWEWMTTWWKYFKKSNRLFIILVYHDHQLLGILPLYVRSKTTLLLQQRKELHPIGFGGPVCPEYPGPIVRRGCIASVCDALLESLLNTGEKWDSLWLDEYACDDEGTTTFANSISRHFPVLSKPGEPRYYIKLPASYEEYLAGLSGHNRRNKRTDFRKAERDYDSKCIHMTAADLASWFPIVKYLSGLSRRRKEQNEPFSCPAYSAFHQDVLRTLLPLDLARVLILRFSDVPVAFRYVFTYNGTIYAYQTGFDPSVRGSPGHILTQYAVMYGISQGFRDFDFLRGSHAHKRLYTNDCRPTRILWAFRTSRGAYCWCCMRERIVKPMRHRLGVLLRSWKVKLSRGCSSSVDLTP